MRAPEDLTKEELAQIVAVVQECFWLDEKDGSWFFNPNKEWDVDMLERIAHELSKCGLRPECKEKIDEAPRGVELAEDLRSCEGGTGEVDRGEE